MIARKMLATVAFLVLALIAACAPAPQDASKARSRDVIQQGGIVAADELRVAEYLQYYPQNLPLPTTSTLGLDLRLGNPQVPAEGGPAWLQVGIAARPAAAEDIAPLNLALVVDRSSSMDSPEKMPLLKQALRVFFRSLASNDIVSLIAFSTEAQVIQPATKVGDGKWIEQATAKLEPNGNTNLHAGLMLGLQEVSRNYDVRRNNRVILLTDGIANTGTTAPDRIAAEARAYNDRGIHLATIGLGHDLNDKLLSQLAIQGKGGYHFVDSAAEIDKIFRKEVSGLMQKAAAEVSIVLRPEMGVRVEGLTGYEGRPPAGTVQVRLQDMGTGDMQVMLANLQIAGGPSGSRPVVTVELHYQDLVSKRDQVVTRSIAAEASRLSNYDPTRDVEVLRNVTIQRTAEGLKEIDRLYKSHRYTDAWQLAYRLEQELRTVARLTNEAQMVQDADLIRRYEDTLAQWVQRETGRPPQPAGGQASDPPIETPSKSRQVLPTPTVPVIEIR